jgi:hypothetical protein|tara:strand:- start:145 stop:372 length:228 start_codon:yes stop_codon:yes gene_type:complete
MFNQIHDLIFHGGGGFIHSEVYNMPVWMRNYHIDRINQHNKKQQEEYDKANGQEELNENSKIQRPNISPSSTFNF